MKGQHVVLPLPHFFQPGADLWHLRLKISFLLTEYNFERHSSFFRLGGCLKAAMGGSSNTAFNSGFLNSMELNCFSKTLLILGRNGLKLKGATSLLVFSLGFFFQVIFSFYQ